MTYQKYITYFFIITVFAMQPLVCLFNYLTDYSCQWSDYEPIAKQSLQGKTIEIPANYNEREYQHQIIKHLSKIPDIIVIGSSRAMYLGKEILNKESVYNHCVSGAILMDYYAITGLYQNYWHKMPDNIIIELSPWIFSNISNECRWTENFNYCSAASNLYETITGNSVNTVIKNFFNNPLFSFKYFYTNLQKALNLQSIFGMPQSLIITQTCSAINNLTEMSDGTILYPKNLEQPGKERLQLVKLTSNKPVTYQDCHLMKGIDSELFKSFELLIEFLKKNNKKITFFLAPFSPSQHQYIIQHNSNPLFSVLEDNLKKFAKKNNIEVIGSYNPSPFNLQDENFIDFMHIDRNSIKEIWQHQTVW